MALQINQRDRLFLMIGGIFIAIVILFQLILIPFLDSKKDQKRILETKQTRYNEMLEMKKKYVSLRGIGGLQAGSGAEREKGFSLYPFMDKLAGTSSIKKNISYMKPSVITNKQDGTKTDQVELKLQNITMKKLVSYLYKIETSKNSVFVTKLSITKAGKNKKQIDAVIMVQARMI